MNDQPAIEEIKEGYNPLSDIRGVLKPFFIYLRRKFLILVLASVLGGGLGVFYYFKQQPKYQAETTFILEDKSAASGLSGLASQFGINVGSFSSGSGMFSGDNILNILSSKKVVEKVLLSNVDDSLYVNKTLADIYLESVETKKSQQRNHDFSFLDSVKQLNPLQDSILNDVYERILKKNLQVERLSRQGSIIRVAVTASNSLFARLLSERLVTEASRLYLEVKTSTAQANIEDLQRRSDSILILLNRKSYSAATSQPLDFNPGIKSAMVPAEIVSRDKTVLATLYSEVIKNLEMSKLMLSQQTPVIQILDKPSILLSDNKKGLLFWIIVFSFVSITFSFIMLGVFYFFSETKK
jgi:uncharacterized protein involved in exopolysaccharide biosynthesis